MDDLQVVIFGGDGSRRIIKGSPGQVQAAIAYVAPAIPAPQAFTMQDTELATSASFDDPRTPVTATAYNNKYPERHYEL